MVIGKIVILLRAFSAIAGWAGSLGVFLADDLIHQRGEPAGVFGVGGASGSRRSDSPAG
jgi:hypothetical protein